jgi:hypothetical protein
MEMSGQLYAPAGLTHDKDHGTRWSESWVSPSAGMKEMAKTTSPFPAPAGNLTPVVQPVAQSLSSPLYSAFSRPF